MEQNEAEKVAKEVEEAISHLKHLYVVIKIKADRSREVCIKKNCA